MGDTLLANSDPRHRAHGALLEQTYSTRAPFSVRSWMDHSRVLASLSASGEPALIAGFSKPEWRCANDSSAGYPIHWIPSEPAGAQCLRPTPYQPFNTPSSRPILMKAAIARSRCSRVCAAEICVRMRAWPCGTTGKKKPIA